MNALCFPDVAFFPSILFTMLVPQAFFELLDIHTVFLGERGHVLGWAAGSVELDMLAHVYL